MNVLFLVQIPHTAGTSLRLAGCRYWGSSRIVSDHGPDNRHTSPLVEELIYLQQDCHQFKENLENNDIALLTTSLPLNGLRRIFPASNIITFVRDPLERLLTEFQQISGGEFSNADFVRFCQRSENQNSQSRYLKALPLELYGFVGISERYSESLRLLNAEFGLELTELSTAQRPTRSNTQSGKLGKSVKRIATLDSENQRALTHRLSPKARETVLRLNGRDIELYQNAYEQFQTRLDLANAKADYIHGRVNQLTREKISGWAVSTHNHNPCKVRVLVNQECVAVTSAREYLGTLKERNVSRDGYVGFSFRFPKKLKSNDIVSCHVHPSDQRLSGPCKPPADK